MKKLMTTVGAIMVAGAVMAAGKVSTADKDGVVRLDISDYINMGFEDECEGDERGGWHDHGDTDARNFPIAKTTFCRVPFKILNPAENVGNSIVVFRNPKKRDGQEEISLDVKPAAKAAYLNLLHCTASPTWRSKEMGTIVVTDEAGKKAEFPVEMGRDAKDWWTYGQPKCEQNVYPAVQIPTQEGNGWCFVSEFKLPDDFGKVANVTIKVAPIDKVAAYWMLVGATLTPTEMRSDIPEEEPEPYAIYENSMYADHPNHWRDFQLPTLQGVVKGSILDYPFNRGEAPHAEVEIRDGEYYYKDDRCWLGKLFGCGKELDEYKDKPVRFMLVNCEMANAGDLKKTSFPQYIGKGMTTNHTQAIKDRVDGFADRGYNAFFVGGNGGVWQRQSEPNGLVYETRMIPDRDFGIKCMKDRGVKRLVNQMRDSGYWQYDYPLRGDPNRIEKEGETPAWIEGSPRRDRTRLAMKQWASQKNELTGTGWLSDPDILGVLMLNECDFHNIKKIEMPFFRKAMQKKYGTLENLKKAWNNPKGSEDWKSFDDLKNDSLGFMNYADERSRDYFDFILHMYRENVLWLEGLCREDYGMTASMTAYDMTKSFFHSLCREPFGVVFMHVYHAHPMHGVVPGYVDISQESPISSANAFFRNMVSTQYDSKPFFMTEFNVCAPNRYRYEQAFVAHCYAALNGFDGMLTFLGPNSGPRRDVHGGVSPFFSGSDPVSHASEFLAMHIFRGGAVRTSPVTVRLQFSEEEMRKTCEYRYAPNALQTKLGLVFRFGLETPKTARPMTANDVAIKTAKGEKMRNEKLFSLVIEDKNDTSFDIAKFLDEMKAKGLLPKENRTNPKKNIWESCTGELYMDSNRKLGVINTKVVQGVFAPDAPHALLGAKMDDFEVCAKTEDGCLCVVGTDGLPIAESKRLTVVYATDAQNRGMLYKDETRRTSINPEVAWKKSNPEKWEKYRLLGSGGVLFNSGKFRVKIHNANAAKLRCWAVGLDGARLQELPVKHLDADHVELAVDETRLNSTPSVFFELCEK